jgi:hypothetical protein
VVRFYGAARERRALRGVLHNRIARSLREGDAHQVWRSGTHDQEPQESGLAVSQKLDYFHTQPCRTPKGWLNSLMKPHLFTFMFLCGLE